MVMNETSSHEFLDEWTSADRGAAAPGVLFRCHGQAVFAVCLANTRNHHDAEDVMQAVFLKAVAKGSSLRNPASARAWLMQTARRECVDFHRRRKSMQPLLQEPTSPASGGDAIHERLHEAVQKLPQNYREVIVLYYLDGRDCSSVAASLGVTPASVRQRLVRARVMLHDLLGEEQP
jgi:RNA polymerase sigma factor (sigma-70 family)